MRIVIVMAIGATLLSAFPAVAECSSGAGDDDFCGSHREAAKTSYVRSSSGRLARFERYKSVSDLIRLLAADDRMRKKYKPFHEGREREERHNVVVNGYRVQIGPKRQEHLLQPKGTRLGASISGDRRRLSAAGQRDH